LQNLFVDKLLKFDISSTQCSILIWSHPRAIPTLRSRVPTLLPLFRTLFFICSNLEPTLMTSKYKIIDSQQLPIFFLENIIEKVEVNLQNYITDSKLLMGYFFSSKSLDVSVMVAVIHSILCEQFRMENCMFFDGYSLHFD